MKPTELPPSNWRELSASELESENLKAAIKRLDTCETLNLALELFHAGAYRQGKKREICKYLRIEVWELARLYQIWQEKNRAMLGEPACRASDRTLAYFWNFWAKKVRPDSQGGLTNG